MLRGSGREPLQEVKWVEKLREEEKGVERELGGEETKRNATHTEQGRATSRVIAEAIVGESRNRMVCVLMCQCQNGVALKFVFGCLCQGGARELPKATIQGPQPTPPERRQATRLF
jgi:hypothetical protein